MAKKTAGELYAQQAMKAAKQAASAALAARKQKDKDIRAIAKSVGMKIPEGSYYTQDYSSVEDFKAKNAQWFDPTYEQPDYGSSYTDPKTGERVSLKASTPEVQAIADILKKAYQDWRAANKGKYQGYVGGTPYTWEEARKYLPKGFKDPQNWAQSLKLGLDVYDQYGNIIPRSSIVPSGMGDLIAKGTYVAPNVMAASMGAPQEEVDRLLGITIAHGGGDPGKFFANWKAAMSNFNFPGQNLVPPPPSTTTPGTTTPGTTTTTTPPPTTPPTTKPTTKPPTVPQFITPYTKPTGFGAFGERDVNPFSKTRKMF